MKRGRTERILGPLPSSKNREKGRERKRREIGKKEIESGLASSLDLYRTPFSHDLSLTTTKI